MECLNKFFLKKPPDDYDYRELQMKVELLEEQISLEIDEKNRHRNTIKRLTSLTGGLFNYLGGRLKVVCSTSRYSNFLLVYRW